MIILDYYFTYYLVVNNIGVLLPLSSQYTGARPASTSFVPRAKRLGALHIDQCRCQPALLLTERQKALSTTTRRV